MFGAFQMYVCINVCVCKGVTGFQKQQFSFEPPLSRVRHSSTSRHCLGLKGKFSLFCDSGPQPMSHGKHSNTSNETRWKSSLQKPHGSIYFYHQDAQCDTSKTPGWKDIKLLMWWCSSGVLLYRSVFKLYLLMGCQGPNNHLRSPSLRGCAQTIAKHCTYFTPLERLAKAHLKFTEARRVYCREQLTTSL